MAAPGQRHERGAAGAGGSRWERGVHLAGAINWAVKAVSCRTSTDGLPGAFEEEWRP
jgi:hypothetical protein